MLYATTEIEPAGAVVAMDIRDPDRPRVLNRESSGGGAPTHLSLDPSGEFLLCANYGSGTVAVLPLGPDGRVGPASDVVRHDGAEPHAHQVLPDPSGGWILSVDLGDDSVYVYELTAGRLRRHDRVALAPGTGPRHLVFQHTGSYMYLVCEHRPQVIVCGWDAAAGRLTPGPIVETVPPGAVTTYPGGGALSAGIPYLYTTNRGEDSVAIFALGAVGATLTRLNNVPTGGIWPRHLVLDPTERWLYVCNQRSGTVTWLPRDPDTGQLGAPAGALPMPAAATLVFPNPTR
jgi:6-phosphogluconolactonase (cycloisomerase 2 family)